MAYRNLRGLWTIAAMLLLSTVAVTGATQPGDPAALLASRLDKEVEALVARTKPDGWENIHACLYYAFAGQYLLAKHGIQSEVHVGAVIYAPGTTSHHGICPHAWLETPDLFIDFSTLPRWGRTSVIPRGQVASHPAAVHPGITQVLALHRPPDPDLIEYLTTQRAHFYSIVNGG